MDFEGFFVVTELCRLEGFFLAKIGDFLVVMAL